MTSNSSNWSLRYQWYTIHLTCIHLWNQDNQHLHHLQNCHILLIIHPPFFPFMPPSKYWSAITTLFAFSRILCKWYHILWIHICLACFIQHIFCNSLMLMPALKICFFLNLSSIPLYNCNKICLSIHVLMDIWTVSSFGLLHININTLG